MKKLKQIFNAAFAIDKNKNSAVEERCLYCGGKTDGCCPTGAGRIID